MIENKLFNILLVEDNPAHAELVIINLCNHPVKNNIYHVSDGEQALDFLYNKGNFADPQTNPRPDLVLLDLKLPRYSGLEVLKRIKTDEILVDIPVVVLTTSDAETDMALAYQYHANSFLVKPFYYEKFSKMMTDFGHYWMNWNKSIKNI